MARESKRIAERVTVEDAVPIIGVSVSKVQKMAARGEIPGAARIGRRWTFDVLKLRRFIAEKENAVCRHDRTRPRAASGVVIPSIVKSRSKDRQSDDPYTQAIRELRDGKSKG